MSFYISWCLHTLPLSNDLNAKLKRKWPCQISIVGDIDRILFLLILDYTILYDFDTITLHPHALKTVQMTAPSVCYAKRHYLWPYNPDLPNVLALEGISHRAQYKYHFLPIYMLYVCIYRCIYAHTCVYMY